ncbi:MAG: 1-deoxy-D-xylulose-5-phosphate synthase [Pseudomonadota bacterium]
MTDLATPLLDRIEGPPDLRALSLHQLETLARELRADIVHSVSRTGGHLGASLGVVELTVALHSVFETPEDVVIWDVGHQAYPHKILTGRRVGMARLRQKDGLSGFTKRAESEHDPFGAGHAGTSISAALGFGVARDHQGLSHKVVAVIGDGSMSAGMAYEALNHAGELAQDLIVVLNDNTMSIDPAVGALTRHLDELKAGTTDRSLFEALGFRYIGPLDGHDLAALRALFLELKAAPTGPVFVHCVTQKGKGYAPAEAAEDRYHGVGKYDPESGAQPTPKNTPPTYSQVFGKTLLSLAEDDPSIIAISAAMISGTGLSEMLSKLPNRVYDTGIAEQHAVTFAAGAAAGGLRPFCALYSCFLQRGYDQVIHDVAIQNLPVRFCIDRAGLVGADGATHAGAYDIGMLAALPNMTVMAAADEAELARMIVTMAGLDDGPSAVRYPRGPGTGAAIDPSPQAIEIGKGRVLRKGKDAAILSFGAHLAEAERACALLQADGIDVTLADARFAKPLDTALVDDLVQNHHALFALEQGARLGFGAIVLEHLAATGAPQTGLKVQTLCLPDRFLDQATPTEMYEEAGLSAEQIAARIKTAIAR